MRPPPLLLMSARKRRDCIDDRPVGQTDRRDVGVGPDPGPAGDLPRQSGIGQLEVMRRSDQRRLVGVLGLRCARTRCRRLFGSDVGNSKIQIFKNSGSGRAGSLRGKQALSYKQAMAETTYFPRRLILARR